MVKNKNLFYGILVIAVLAIVGMGLFVLSKPSASSTPLPEVTITTDKTEYALGEKARIIVRNGLEKPIWYVDYVCPPWWTLEIQDKSNWKKIDEFSPQLFRPCKEGEKFCHKGYIKEHDYCISPWINRAQGLIKSLAPNSEISKIWSLSNYIYHNGYTVEGLAPGKYRLSFAYGFTQDAYSTDFVYSNEFEVKKGFWRKISDVCREEKEFVEEIRSDPECLKGEEFGCVDGWSLTWYYDKRRTSTTEFPETWPSKAPKELRDATIAKYGRSTCSCEKPISYEILVGDKFEEVSCEEFYQFLQNYESSCGDCILTWSSGCC